MIILVWIISLIVLIASVVFVYRMLITSSEFTSTDKSSPFKFLKAGSGRDKFYRQSLSVLQSRIKSLEDSNAYYEIQFSKFKLQLKDQQVLSSEELPSLNIDSSSASTKEEEEEDWQELYFQENENKVQLENDLDEAQQNLEAANKQILKLKEEVQKTANLKSLHDARLIELTSLQNETEILKKKINGAEEYGKELQILLNKEIALKNVYNKIENENIRLRSELEDLKRQITEMHQREIAQERQLARARELQSHIGMHEEEKKRKMMELNNKIEKNKVFSK